MSKDEQIQVRIDLTKLQGATLNAKGQLVIDPKKAHLFVGEKGSVNLEMDLKQNPKNEQGNKRTHLVNHRIPKGIYEKMTHGQTADFAKDQKLLGQGMNWNLHKELFPKKEQEQTKQKSMKV